MAEVIRFPSEAVTDEINQVILGIDKFLAETHSETDHAIMLVALVRVVASLCAKSHDPAKMAELVTKNLGEMVSERVR